MSKTPSNGVKPSRIETKAFGIVEGVDAPKRCRRAAPTTRQNDLFHELTNSAKLEDSDADLGTKKPTRRKGLAPEVSKTNHYIKSLS